MEQLRGILRQYWGYDGFRPLQPEAMRAVLDGRDSLVVLPTGGGKSLCFQAPAMCLDGLAVVVSPLISLMHDQVDALADCGVPAACVNSSLGTDERRRVADELRGGRLKLLYLSPERLMTDRMLEFLGGIPLAFFAIDEAHCISDWGHDFRPEYRALATLKTRFPKTAVHAYTATATPRVQEDIVRELKLKGADVLVGSFDRPNLVFRAQRRGDLMKQIRGVIDRHREDSGLVYCIRRADVDEICATLASLGYQALPYHAGMSDEDRRRNQRAFVEDRTRIIVATVAFGMGIDKSNVRYVIHAAAPKSLEAYQQECGRAGRDGLEAECWLFYSPADFQVWRRLQSDLPEQAFAVAMQVLAGIDNFCTATTCRHRAVVEYFGQYLESDDCGACDVCLAELDLVDDALIVAQKIISCVLRLRESFGGDYTAQVLVGSREQRIVANKHDELSTYGLLKEHDKRHVRDWIEQLVNQAFLEKEGEYQTLSVTPTGRDVLRGAVTPRLLKPAKKSPASKKRVSRAETDSWEGVDRELFDELRKWRTAKAQERSVPPYVVFSDKTLRDLARRRPSSLESLPFVHGIGQRKSAEYGQDVLRLIADHCRESGTSMDIDLPTGGEVFVEDSETSRKPNPVKRRAFELFSLGQSLADVSTETNRAMSTTMQYLAEYIETEGLTDPTPWVPAADFARIKTSLDRIGFGPLKPIFENMGGAISYEQIRIAVACLRNEPRAESTDL